MTRINTIFISLVTVLIISSCAAIPDYSSTQSRNENGEAPSKIDSTFAGSAIVGFSPSAEGLSAEQVVLKSIKEAKTSIHMAAYSFTSRTIAEALIDARKRGLDVRVVADKRANVREYSVVSMCAAQGVLVRLNARYSIMHNKFLVIDGTTIETGSFNFTAAAARNNAENALLLRNVVQLANAYEMEWNRLWNESDVWNSQVEK